MKNLIAIFTVTAALSGGIVFAAASGAFGDASSASNKAKIVRPGDDPRSMEDLRQEILKKKGSTIDSSQIVRPADDPRTKEQIQAEALQKLKELKHGSNPSPEFKQGPDLASPTVVTSPEEEAAGNVGSSATPRNAPPQQSSSANPLGTSAEPTTTQPGPSKEKIKEIINKRANP
jgi:hypothetical protein